MAAAGRRGVRTNANTKREKAISAAILDAAAAQIMSEAEHGCVGDHEASALDTYARGIRNVAGRLFNQSQPSRKP
jgi:hypothetical protein